MERRLNSVHGLLIGAVIGMLMWAGLFMLVAWAAAGSYTVTTTADQDAALAELSKHPGPQVRPRGPATEALLTPHQIIQNLVDRDLAGPVATQKRAAACKLVTDANATKAADAKQALGCPK